MIHDDRKLEVKRQMNHCADIHVPETSHQHPHNSTSWPAKRLSLQEHIPLCQHRADVIHGVRDALPQSSLIISPLLRLRQPFDLFFDQPPSLCRSDCFLSALVRVGVFEHAFWNLDRALVFRFIWFRVVILLLLLRSFGLLNHQPLLLFLLLFL